MTDTPFTDRLWKTLEGKTYLNAYYYGFNETGIQEVDNILSAFAMAGKSFHDTSQWCDPFGVFDGLRQYPIGYGDFFDGVIEESVTSLKRRLAEHGGHTDD